MNFYKSIFVLYFVVMVVLIFQAFSIKIPIFGRYINNEGIMSFDEANKVFYYKKPNYGDRVINETILLSDLLLNNFVINNIKTFNGKSYKILNLEHNMLENGVYDEK